MKKIIYILPLLLVTMCFSQSASFDSSFGTNGKVLINRCPNSYGIFAVDLQSDEKIVHGFGGYSNVYAIFSRSNSNGILDATFGTNGYYELSTITTNVLQPESNYTMVEFEVQNDNKIVSAGRRESISASTFCVSRILANGGLDTSFNGTGFLEVSFGAGTSRGNCMKLQSNGKILVGGRSGSSSQFFSLLRLNTDGSFDTTFGSAGKVQTLMIGQSLPNSIAIQTDGKILMGGYVLNNPYGYDFAVVRYLVNGTLDTSFGVNGIVITTINTFYNDVINKVLVQNDGKIIVVGNNADGTGESRMAMVRYNSNGAVDTTFANNGIYISGYYGGANDAAFQVDGKIVCSGSVFTSDYLFNVVRFNVNGIIDDDFLLSNVSNPFNYSSGSFSLLIQPDNKIVAGGVAGIDETCQVSLGAIIRINPGTLSNEEFSKTKTVVYPNPTSSNVFFDNSVNQYENGSVYNYLGQEILKQELGFSSSESINISTIANGVYLLKFNNEKGSETIKIVKEKH